MADVKAVPNSQCTVERRAQHIVQQVRPWPDQFLVKVFYFFFSTEACKYCITYSSKRSTVNRPLDHIIHTDIQYVLT